MPDVVVYDQKGNKVVLRAVGYGMFEKIDKDGKETGNIVNLKTAIQCGSLFTEEQHRMFLEKQRKRERK